MKYSGDKFKRHLARGFIYAFCIIIAISAFFPFYSMLISSSHSAFHILTRLNLLPGDQFIRNYERLTVNMNIWRGMLNSLMVAAADTSITVYFSLLTAYAFAKFRFKGRDALFMLIIISMMLPGQLGIIGFFRQMSAYGFLNTYWPMILPSIASTGSVFFLKQYLDGALPDEIIESAYVDGCREITIYHKLVIPMSMPGIVTIAVMSFIGSWNSYLTPLIMLRSPSMFTLPLMIATVRDALHADYGALFMGLLVSTLPLVIVFMFSSKVIMEEISIGAAVKG